MPVKNNGEKTMILIHVYQNDTFETEFEHGCPRRAAYRAAKDGAVKTLCADIKAPAFGTVFRDFARAKLSTGPYIRWQALKGDIPGWKLWAAKCTTEYGAWFHTVTPEPLDEIKARILGHIDRRTNVSLGVLVNLCRPLTECYVKDILAILEQEKKATVERSSKGQNTLICSRY